MAEKSTEKELLNMSPMQQLLIVAGVLISLPFAVKLLWKLYLFPLAFWIAATRLFWPKWAEENGVLSLALLAASILFFSAPGGCAIG